jgi:pSer/pThr/pTyr-binding forkhead associated (FHA) protein
MNDLTHATLAFVAGPQAGQRVVLTKAVAILGRGSEADVLLSEDYASRQQARYELVRAGATLENLSPKGTWVNGKLYKAGKKLLLETGDLLGVGAETEILFIAAGDDPDTALALHNQAMPPKSAFGKKHRARIKPEGDQPKGEAPEDEPGVEEDNAPDEFDRRPRQKRASEMTPAERARFEDEARRKKIMIGLGIYLAILAVIVIAVVLYRTPSRDEGGTPIPYMLTPAEIRAALAGRIEKSPNPVKKESKLQEALELYQQHGLEPLYLHKCLVAFKESLAYGGREFFDDPEDGQKYRDVLDKLIRVVQERYRNAYILERNKDWKRAEREFGMLLRIVPDRESLIFKDVQKHHGRVRAFLQKEEGKKKRGPLG